MKNHPNYKRYNMTLCTKSSAASVQTHEYLKVFFPNKYAQNSP